MPVTFFVFGLPNFFYVLGCLTAFASVCRHQRSLEEQREAQDSMVQALNNKATNPPGTVLTRFDALARAYLLGRMRFFHGRNQSLITRACCLLLVSLSYLCVLPRPSHRSFRWYGHRRSRSSTGSQSTRSDPPMQTMLFHSHTRAPFYSAPSRSTHLHDRRFVRSLFALVQALADQVIILGTEKDRMEAAFKEKLLRCCAVSSHDLHLFPPEGLRLRIFVRPRLRPPSHQPLAARIREETETVRLRRALADCEDQLSRRDKDEGSEVQKLR